MITKDMKNIFFDEFVAHPKWYLRELRKFHGMDHYDKYFQKIHYIFGQMKGRMIAADGVLNYERMGEDVRDKTIDILEVTDVVLNKAKEALEEDDVVHVARYYAHVESMQRTMTEYLARINEVYIPNYTLYIADKKIG